MPAIYGDSLLHFNEQEQIVQYFHMVPRINSGYDIDIAPVPINVIIHNLDGDEVKGIMDNLGYTACFSLWSRQVLNNGWFITYSDGYIYRMHLSKDWTQYGGFIYFHLERVVGDDGQLVNDVQPNLGNGLYQ